MNTRLLVVASWDARDLLLSRLDLLDAREPGVDWNRLLDAGKTLANAARFVLDTAPTVARAEECQA